MATVTPASSRRPVIPPSAKWGGHAWASSPMPDSHTWPLQSVARSRPTHHTESPISTAPNSRDPASTGS